MEEDLKQKVDITGDDADALNGADKTFTQAEIDKIVADRLAREKKKYADYDSIKADNERLRSDNMAFKQLSDLIVNGQLGGAPVQQVNQLQDFYGISENEAQAVYNAGNNEGDNSKAYNDAKQFEKEASDEDIISEVEKILKKPVKERTDEDYTKLEVLELRFGKIKWKAEYGAANAYCKENSDFKLDELMKNEDFIDFISDSRDELVTLVKRYLKNIKKKEPSNPGSVKDKSGFAEKEYYTKDEVDKLSEKDLGNPKVWEKVRKSMTKWK